MQTVVQVLSNQPRSLRDVVGDDKRLPDYGFEVVREKKPGRRPGWTKLKSTAPTRRGSMNVQWHAQSRLLICRVINRGKGRPSLIVGDFVDYLLDRHARKVRSITVYQV